MRQYGIDNPEYRKTWYAENRNEQRLDSGLRRAKSYGTEWKPFNWTELEQYWKSNEIDPQECYYCEGPFEEIDHVQPLAKKGPHLVGNIVPSCSPCNRAKADREI